MSIFEMNIVTEFSQEAKMNINFLTLALTFHVLFIMRILTTIFDHGHWYYRLSPFFLVGNIVVTWSYHVFSWMKLFLPFSMDLKITILTLMIKIICFFLN